MTCLFVGIELTETEIEKAELGMEDLFSSLFNVSLTHVSVTIFENNFLSSSANDNGGAKASSTSSTQNNNNLKEKDDNDEDVASYQVDVIIIVETADEATEGAKFLNRTQFTLVADCVRIILANATNSNLTDLHVFMSLLGTASEDDLVTLFVIYTHETGSSTIEIESNQTNTKTSDNISSDGSANTVILISLAIAVSLSLCLGALIIRYCVLIWVKWDERKRTKSANEVIRAKSDSMFNTTCSHDSNLTSNETNMTSRVTSGTSGTDGTNTTTTIYASHEQQSHQRQATFQMTETKHKTLSTPTPHTIDTIIGSLTVPVPVAMTSLEDNNSNVIAPPQSPPVPVVIVSKEIGIINDFTATRQLPPTTTVTSALKADSLLNAPHLEIGVSLVHSSSNNSHNNNNFDNTGSGSATVTASVNLNDLFEAKSKNMLHRNKFSGSDTLHPIRKEVNSPELSIHSTAMDALISRKNTATRTNSCMEFVSNLNATHETSNEMMRNYESDNENETERKEANNRNFSNTNNYIFSTSSNNLKLDNFEYNNHRTDTNRSNWSQTESKNDAANEMLLTEYIENEPDLEEFEIKKILGVGTFGNVYKAVWNGEVVSVLSVSKSNEPMLQCPFELLRTLPFHRNLMQIIQIQDHLRTKSVIMEYIDYGSLKRHCYRDYNNFDLSLFEKYMILYRVCSGLKFLHQFNFVHRDIGSHNIFLSKLNNLRSIDFETEIKVGGFCMMQSLDKTETQTPTKTQTPNEINIETKTIELKHDKHSNSKSGNYHKQANLKLHTQTELKIETDENTNENMNPNPNANINTDSNKPNTNIMISMDEKGFEEEKKDMNEIDNENNEMNYKEDFGPLKWMAPESLESHIYSKETDVYMFGM